MSVTVVLWDIASEMNLGLVVRACYVLGQGHARLVVYDPQSVTTRSRDAVRRFSSYSIDHFDGLQVLATEHEARAFLAVPDGRTIVATPDETDSTELSNFHFTARDRIVFGNEYHGLPPDLVAAATHRVTIPMHGPAYGRPDLGGRVRGVGTQRCLSLISSVSILLYAALLETAACAE